MNAKQKRNGYAADIAPVQELFISRRRAASLERAQGSDLEAAISDVRTIAKAQKIIANYLEVLETRLDVALSEIRRHTFFA